MARNRLAEITLLFTALLLAAMGCQALPASGALPQDGAADANGLSRQLMIRFRNAQAPCDAAQIASVALATSQTLRYRRAMSGQACVITQHAGDAAALSAGLDRLRRHPAIEWAEEDGVMRALR